MLKTIKGYENRYMVSDSGQIYSLLRDKTLKGVPNSSGYLRVQLHDGKGHKSHLFIHRIVAEAFCDHPQGCDVVNHIDFNPLNNRADNLEWTTFKGNMRYSADRGRLDKTEEWKRKIIESQRRKAVIATSRTDGKERFFEGVNEVRNHGFDPSCVCACCEGKRQSHAGYFWRYAP